MPDDRLDEPPFESLEERAGGRFEPAGEGNRGAGCSAGCFGCVVVLALMLGAGAWFLVVFGKPDRSGRIEIVPPPSERTDREEEPEAPPAAVVRPAPEVTPEPPPAPEPAASDAEDRALDAKVRAIRQAALDPSRAVREGALAYHEWCDRNEGPPETAADLAPRGPSALVGVEITARKLASALSNGPDSPALDTAARRWINALQSVAPIIKDAHEYYSQGRWREDQLAEGRELHPRLEKAWSVFAGAQRSLEDALRVEEVRLRSSGRIIAALERDPARAWELRARRLAAAADEVLDSVAVPSGAPPAERVVPIRRALEALKQAADALEPTPALSGARPLAGLPTLERAARDLSQAAEERAADIASPRALPEADLRKLKGPNAWQVAGTEERVRQRYERTLEAYLRLKID